MQIIHILWLRQMRRFWRSRSRILGSIGQPLLFLLALGYGLGAVYEAAGQSGYMEFLVPGVVVQTILFSSIFWGTIIIFDRRFGFLSELLVAPVVRLKILLGSTLGGASISFIQATLLLGIAILIGFRPDEWLMLPVALLVMLILSLTLTFFGAGIASMVEDFQGFQAITNFLVFPLFFLSSALYPLDTAPAILKFLGSINPVSYMVDLLRHTLIGTGHFSVVLDIAVITATLIAGVVFAVNRFNRIQM
jgi:ABC-2 type transport system permease protein